MQNDAMTRVSLMLGRALIEREMAHDRAAALETEVKRLKAENEGLQKEISGGVSD